LHKNPTLEGDQHGSSNSSNSISILCQTRNGFLSLSPKRLILCFVAILDGLEYEIFQRTKSLWIGQKKDREREGESERVRRNERKAMCVP